jgi:hypothetical protein
MKQDTNRKITVDDLLRLKRAERPPAEFWASFESELRAKQLAAIVGKRSWRDALPRIFTTVYRYHLPFGAVAALALTWAGIHYSSDSADSVRTVPSLAARPLVHASVPVSSVVQTAESSGRPQAQARIAAPQTVSAPMAVATTPSSEVSAPEVPKAAIGTRFSDVVAATLADFRENQPELARRDVFSSDREFETTVESMHQAAVEPLAHVDPAAEERNSRLLEAALPAYGPSSNAATVASERVRQRASNDRMYESMDPYESNSPSLEIRF